MAELIFHSEKEKWETEGCRWPVKMRRSPPLLLPPPPFPHKYWRQWAEKGGKKKKNRGNFWSSFSFSFFHFCHGWTRFIWETRVRAGPKKMKGRDWGGGRPKNGNSGFDGYTRHKKICLFIHESEGLVTDWVTCSDSLVQDWTKILGYCSQKEMISTP